MLAGKSSYRSGLSVTMTLRALLLLAACAIYGQAHAGLFSDEETRKQVKELEARISLMEDAAKQRTQVMLEMQTQLEAMGEQVRKLQGQNEELLHNIQDAEKRQKDFYIDLDSRLRRFEAGSVQSAPSGSADTAVAPIDPVAENKDYDAAYGLYKANKQQMSIAAFQDFIKKYPGSTLAPNAYYWMGVAFYALKDYKNAVNSYLTAASKYPASEKAPSALLGAAICYQEMGDVAGAKKTLKQIIANYPDSTMTPRAKKRLESIK
jgi:tol-pal system protein YbgF